MASARRGHARQQAHQHVGEDREPSHQVELLEDEAHVGAQLADAAVDVPVALDHVPAHGDRAAAAIGRDEARYVPQQRRLARARRADEGHHLARRHREADTLQRAARTEGLAESLDREGGSEGGGGVREG
jgi:hypothetical protein